MCLPAKVVVPDRVAIVHRSLPLRRLHQLSTGYVTMRSPALTLLDPAESTVRFTPGSTLSGDRSVGFELGDYRRHFDWQRDRQRVYQALGDAYVPHSRRAAFAQCGRGGWVLKRRDALNEFAVVPKYCHDRFCKPCARQRSWLIRKNLSAQLPDHPCRFVTLTLRSESEPLQELLDKLRDSFTKLRKHPFWTTHVKGGAAFIEVKWSDRASRWHPHLHIICHGTYIPQGVLSVVWERITGTSFIVDVRLIRSRKEMLQYVTKYATKSVSSGVLHKPEHLAEAVLALQGRKLCAAFGDWAALHLLKSDAEGDWELLCPLDKLAALCREGDDDACTIEAAIHCDAASPREMRYTAHPPPIFYAVDLVYHRPTFPTRVADYNRQRSAVQQADLEIQCV